MSLRKRAGKWHWRYTVDGKEYSGPTDLDATKRNASAAVAIEAEHRRAIREGRAPGRRLTARRFSDAAVEYLSWCESEHRERPSTARRIRTSFASLGVRFAEVMVGGLTAREVEGYKSWRIAEHKVRDVTLRHDLHALSGFFRWAMRVGYAVENPVRHVRIPSDKDAVRIHVLTADEERAYFVAAQADSDLHDLARFLLAQGCRPDEALHLTPADIDLASGSAVVRRSKTAAGRRTLTLTAESRSILARRCAGLTQGAPLWRCSVSGLAKRHHRVLAQSGANFVLYDLRHTFATRMAQAGCDLATLAAILGHSSLRLVQRYVHPTAEHQAAAMRRYEGARAIAEREGVVQ